MKLSIQDIDVVYMSYDEPKADEFYADLKEKCPWAKRVHGVKGFDNAHKACADIAETDRFITVDGDNLVDADFFSKEIEVTYKQSSCVFSWAGLNMVNGLLYGNGGLKCWPTEFVKNMKTHENSDGDGAVDFCWDDSYVQMMESYSRTYPNGSPFQAYRAGFREGVKMTLDRGHHITLDQMNTLWHGNLKRLEIWCSVGADMVNGLWCIYGARCGAYSTNLSRWNHELISDYEWFDHHWKEEVEPLFSGGSKVCPHTEYNWNEERLKSEIKIIGDKLRRAMDLNIAELDEDGSRFFKHVYVAPSRTGYD